MVLFVRNREQHADRQREHKTVQENEQTVLQRPPGKNLVPTITTSNLPIEVKQRDSDHNTQIKVVENELLELIVVILPDVQNLLAKILQRAYLDISAVRKALEVAVI